MTQRYKPNWETSWMDPDEKGDFVAIEDYERLRADIKRMDANHSELLGKNLELQAQLRIPHPARDFANEFNELLAAKNREIERLQAGNAQLQSDNETLVKFMDDVRDSARGNNPKCATVLDFMVCWNNRYEEIIAKLKVERAALLEICKQTLPRFVELRNYRRSVVGHHFKDFEDVIEMLRSVISKSEAGHA